MSIFKKNPNEVLYQGGEKHFLEVIKNTGNGEYLIWRQPEEDFNTNSKLIVMPGEMALFVNEGKIVQEFSEGTYQLSTKNYPFISRLKNVSSGGISAFNCVVYFFRKADSKELRWGILSPIRATDKVYGIHTDVKARGSYKVRIENPSLFLENLVGNNIRFQEQSDLDDYFLSQIQTEARRAISEFLNEYQGELSGLDAHLSEVSGQVEPKINMIFANYGLKCVNFNVAAMDVEKEKYEQIDAAQLESIRKMKQGQGEAAYMNTLGDNWDKLQNANIMMEVAQNKGAGSISSLGAGIRLGAASGNVFEQVANQMFSGTTENKQQEKPAAEDPIETLGKLKKMLDAGLIEQSEYDAKKQEILSRM